MGLIEFTNSFGEKELFDPKNRNAVERPFGYDHWSESKKTWMPYEFSDEYKRNRGAPTERSDRSW